MAILSAVIGALSTFYQDSHDPTDPQQVEIIRSSPPCQNPDHRGLFL